MSQHRLYSVESVSTRDLSMRPTTSRSPTSSAATWRWFPYGSLWLSDFSSIITAQSGTFGWMGSATTIPVPAAARER